MTDSDGVVVIWMYEEMPGNHKWIPFYDVDQAFTDNAYMNGEKYVELVAEGGNTIVVDFESMSQQVLYSGVLFGVPHKVCRCCDLGKSMSITVVPKPKWELAESNSNISADDEKLSAAVGRWRQIQSWSKPAVDGENLGR